MITLAVDVIEDIFYVIRSRGYDCPSQATRIAGKVNSSV